TGTSTRCGGSRRRSAASRCFGSWPELPSLVQEIGQRLQEHSGSQPRTWNGRLRKSERRAPFMAARSETERTYVPRRVGNAGRLTRTVAAAARVPSAASSSPLVSKRSIATRLGVRFGETRTYAAA